jgi:hypothetical protein
MACIVYKYGLGRPTENADLVYDQIFKGHQTYNAYLAVARTNRGQRRVLYERHRDPILEETLRATAAERTAAAEALKEARVLASNKRVPRLIQERLNKAKKAHKAAKDAKALHNKRVKELTQADRDIISEEHNAERRRVYAQSDAYVGTQLLIRESVEHADGKTALYKDGAPHDPKFKPWKHEGRIGIYKAPKIPVKEVFEEGNWVRIASVDDRAWSERRQGESSKRHEGKRYCSRTTLRIRIGSEGQKPIWASFPMIMHRPLPDNGLIPSVSVHLEKIGPREVWTACFTVDVSGCLKYPESTTGNAVALDLGWREIRENPDGVDYALRMACWIGEDGATGELRIPARFVSGIKLEREISRIRKNNYNQMLASLVEWARERDLPEWLRRSTMSGRARKAGEATPSSAQAVARLSKWVSIAKLAALTLQWSKNRFEGDEGIYGHRPDKDGNGKPLKETAVGLEGWRYNDHHLWAWENSQRRNSRNQRKELYRQFALELALKYRTLVLEDFNISDVAETAELGTRKEIDRNDKAQSNRQIASPSELRECCIQAFTKRGGRVVKVNPAYTSRTCHKCRRVVNLGAALTHACVCGETWDRDDNARRNILGIWLERPGDAQVTVTAREDTKEAASKEDEESRYAKRRRFRAAKLERLAAARNQGAMAAE